MQEREHQTKPLSISTGFVEVDGGQLYYEVAGQGHPLIFLQGRNFDRRIWDDQFATFAQNYQVVRYDARGSGKSPNTTSPYREADDLAHVLQALKLEKSYLLDLGGSIILDFIYKYASSVDALILVSPGISPAQSATEAMDELPKALERYAPAIDAIQQSDMEGAIDAIMQNLLEPSLISSEEYQHVRTIVADRFQSIFEPSMPPTVDIQAFNTRSQWLRQTQIPTLLLVGEKALPEVRSSVAALEKSIPRAQVYEIAHARFLLNIERPEEFNRTVLSFLQILP
jgi:pimeloyl-ACP methyl ester carboxylesterase